MARGVHGEPSGPAAWFRSLLDFRSATPTRLAASQPQAQLAARSSARSDDLLG